jgi:preprotein translocase subunit SecD
MVAKIGAKPMKLGLDLRGGVHFLLEVDMDKAIAQRMETSATDFVVNSVTTTSNLIVFHSITMPLTFSLPTILTVMRRWISYVVMAMSSPTSCGNDTGSSLRLTYTDARRQEIQSYAVNQNLTTLRNRINELGVAEALVQTQGNNRIVVELPGVQDTAEAKRVLGRTANLEFRLVSDQNDQYIDPIQVNIMVSHYLQVQKFLRMNLWIVVVSYY